MIAIFPYIVVVGTVVWLTDDRPLLAPRRHFWNWRPDADDYTITAFMTVLFGAVLGYSLFRHLTPSIVPRTKWPRDSGNE